MRLGILDKYKLGHVLHKAMPSPSTDITQLYRRRDDGSVGVHTVMRSMYDGDDAFQQALDEYYAMGYEERVHQVLDTHHEPHTPDPTNMSPL